MNLVGTFSGIGGFELAAQNVGIDVKAVCEIDKYANQVTEKHFGIDNLKDIRDVSAKSIRGYQPDIITGGFPCQDLSTAGSRAGLAGKRSRLFFEFARIIAEVRPRWFIIENVPGLLSSQEGYDFATVIQTLGEIGYICPWRSFDARYFNVAQQRERVFIVGSLGNASSVEVLFEPDSSSWNTTPSSTLEFEVANAITTRNGKMRNPINATFVIQRMYYTHRNQQDRIYGTDGLSPALLSYLSSGSHRIYTRQGVRILTPVECERLQGFPDNWTAGHSDTQRWKMTGNAVAVPVAEWILKRIADIS